MTPPPHRARETGVVLINVLVILALTSSVVFAMVTLSDLSIRRSQRFSDAAQAQALIAAGEASAVVALRRDLADGPGSDHLAEPWASSGQQDVAIAAGRFALKIEDAQARFNLNSLPGSGALGAQILGRILTMLDLPEDVGLRIAARLSQPEPLTALADLRREAGLSDAQVATLASLVTVLPGKTDINVNTAPEALLSVLADNPVQARQLQGIRSRKGFLDADDIAAANLVLPAGAGFASRHFLVTTTVTVGDTTQTFVSLLQRRANAAGAPDVAVIGRQMERAAMSQSPPA